MPDRIKGTLLGFLASFGGVAGWIILNFVGFIAGIAGAGMGILFAIVYTKLNPLDDSKYKYVMACVITVIDIVIAELICLAIEGAIYGYTFAEALNNDAAVRSIIINVVVGIILSGISLGGYIRRQIKNNN